RDLEPASERGEGQAGGEPREAAGALPARRREPRGGQPSARRHRGPAAAHARAVHQHPRSVVGRPAARGPVRRCRVQRGDRPGDGADHGDRWRGALPHHRTQRARAGALRDFRPKVDIGGRAALHCAAVNRSIRPLLILVLLATSLAACSRCGSRPEAGSERTALARVPTDAAGALWIPDLGLFGERVAELQRLELLDFAAPMLRQPSGTAPVDALVRQLGVDPRTREGLKAAGLEPGRDAAFASPVSGELLSVLPVSDAKVLEDNVRRLAQRLLAARAVTEVRVGEHRLLHFSRREGSPPVLGFAVVGNFALLLTEGLLGDAERVARLLSGSDEGMAANAVFSASRQRLGGKPLAWGYLAGGRGLLPQGTVEGVGAAFDLSLSGLSMR